MKKQAKNWLQAAFDDLSVIGEIIQNENLSHMVAFHSQQAIEKSIKAILEEKGIKQTWLAEKLDKSYNMVNSYAQNRRQPSLEDLYKIATILDVDIKNLLISNKDE
mgnify:CR=1 FL=1